MDTAAEKYRRRIGFWRCTALLALAAFLVTLIALVAIVVVKDRQMDQMSQTSLPCPASDEEGGGGAWGLLTSGDPVTPSPFHDITVDEYTRLLAYLRTVEVLNLQDPNTAAVNTSNIFIADLYAPSKAETVRFLDEQGTQPPREARVIVFRGDKAVPQVEEYRVGPLSNPTYCVLLSNPNRRNPVQFSMRPIGGVEFTAVYKNIMTKVDKEIGFALKENYGGQFTNCTDDCLMFYPSPVSTNLFGSAKRAIWFWGNYPAEYYSLHPLDFGVRGVMQGSDPAKWTVDKVFFRGQMFDSLQEAAQQYRAGNIEKIELDYVRNTRDLYSTINMRGDPVPESPKRPPVQVEPDGKRYNISHRHFSYQNWHFDFRLSALQGPQLFDVRYQGQRIAYELGLSEIAVYYSGAAPMQRVTDFVDGGALLGTHSKSLIPGADCPEGATFLHASFLGEAMTTPTTLQRSTCVFEQNNGFPLRRHLSYAREQGAFYGGMEDNVLVVRSILTVVNYDYIFDYIFHQSGALEVRAMSTGYILSTFYSADEALYGFRLAENINGNIHHHMFHFRADLDILGTSNRYETLDMKAEEVELTQMGPGAVYHQTYFEQNVKRREMEAVYDYNFNTPKYHIVYNDQARTKYDVPRAYRIHLAGMSKQLIPEDLSNEGTIPWARHQLVCTVQKDNERMSSSPYAMFDSLQPVTNFTRYFADDEMIKDRDLVFWITLGTHHIPHTEDLPVTPTVGGQLSFFLLPYNYFEEGCPSLSSRDGIRVEYAKPGDASQGLRVVRNGNKESATCGARTLEQLVRDRPDDFLQTFNDDFRLL